MAPFLVLVYTWHTQPSLQFEVFYESFSPVICPRDSLHVRGPADGGGRRCGISFASTSRRVPVNPVRYGVMGFMYRWRVILPFGVVIQTRNSFFFTRARCLEFQMFGATIVATLGIERGKSSLRRRLTQLLLPQRGRQGRPGSEIQLWPRKVFQSGEK